MDGDHAEVDHHLKNVEENGRSSESGRLNGVPIDSESVSEFDTKRCLFEDFVRGASTSNRHSNRSRVQDPA